MFAKLKRRLKVVFLFIKNHSAGHVLKEFREILSVSITRIIYHKQNEFGQKNNTFYTNAEQKYHDSNNKQVDQRSECVWRDVCWWVIHFVLQFYLVTRKNADNFNFYVIILNLWGIW